MKLALAIALLTAACGADATDNVDMPGAAPTLATTLPRHSLGGSSLAALQLVSTPHGRTLFSDIVACALPSGATLTTIDRAGVPFSFAGERGLAPAWADRPATADERARVTACLDARRPKQA